MTLEDLKKKSDMATLAMLSAQAAKEKACAEYGRRLDVWRDARIEYLRAKLADVTIEEADRLGFVKKEPSCPN